VDSADLSLSIVIPACNESRRLPATLDAALAALAERAAEEGGGPTGSPGEVIVVDDGSTDSTADLVAAVAASHPAVRLLRNGTNRGKGYSVRRGMLEARGRLVLFTDADASAPLPEAAKLLAVLDAGEADVAIGSRELPGSDLARPQPWPRRMLGWVFRQLVRLLVVRGFRDTQCGFKAFRREAAREIFRRQTLDGFAFDVEALFLARRLGYRVVEVPVRWLDSSESRVRPVRDGFRMLCDLVRIRLRARRPAGRGRSETTEGGQRI
jgi:dolichyl-phosphate beta-glucosyltransferase